MAFSYDKARVEGWKSKTFEQCLESNDPICELAPCAQVAFICGYHWQCFQCSKETLRRAANNVLQHYPVVGLVEEMNKTVAVMEAELPSFYSGVKKAYDEVIAVGYETANEAEYKPASEDFLQSPEFRKRWRIEYEFYHFLRQRLHQQFKSVQNKDVLR